MADPGHIGIGIGWKRLNFGSVDIVVDGDVSDDDPLHRLPRNLIMVAMADSLDSANIEIIGGHRAVTKIPHNPSSRLRVVRINQWKRQPGHDGRTERRLG